MKYLVDTLIGLIEEVESQGGALLDDLCVRREVDYSDRPHTMLDDRGRPVKTHTQGCNNETRFVTIYDPGENVQSGAGFVTACAVCDSMGAWPRYEKAVKALDSTYWDDLKDAEEDE